MIYQITLQSQLKALGFAFLLTALYGFACVFFWKEPLMLIVLASFWGVSMLPVVLLHLRYRSVNNGVRIEFANDGLVVHNTDGERRIGYDKIKLVTLHKSGNTEKGGIQMFPHESYHYLKVVTSDQDQVVVTSLVVPDLETTIRSFPNLRFERRRTFFAFPNSGASVSLVP